MCRKNKDNKKFPSVFAPFLILKVEKMYYSWIASFIIAFMGVIVDIANSSIDNSFLQGAFFSTCITLLAPFFVEFFVDYTFTNRAQQTEKYTTYKGASLLICFVVMFLLCIFYATAIKTNKLIQIISTIIVGILSLYLYLVSKMDKHPNLLMEYKDVSYFEAEQNVLDKMTTDAKNLTSVEGNKGEEIKL